METTTTSNRIHPLMAAAAVSLTVVSLVGAAAIAGILPTSHSANADNPPAVAAQAAPVAAAAPAPVVREVVRYKTVVRHERDGEHVRLAQADQDRDAQAAPNYQQQPAPAPAQAAAAPKNSALGIGIGAVVGGLIGNHVGGGNGRTLATIAGAVGGGYVGNEIAKNSQAGQTTAQPAGQ